MRDQKEKRNQSNSEHNLTVAIKQISNRNKN
jgi:hypothetical protein